MTCEYAICLEWNNRLMIGGKVREGDRYFADMIYFGIGEWDWMSGHWWRVRNRSRFMDWRATQ